MRWTPTIGLGFSESEHGEDISPGLAQQRAEVAAAIARKNASLPTGYILIGAAILGAVLLLRRIAS
jgi:hypothetical protein